MARCRRGRSRASRDTSRGRRCPGVEIGLARASISAPPHPGKAPWPQHLEAELVPGDAVRAGEVEHAPVRRSPGARRAPPRRWRPRGACATRRRTGAALPALHRLQQRVAGPQPPPAGVAVEQRQPRATVASGQAARTARSASSLVRPYSESGRRLRRPPRIHAGRVRRRRTPGRCETWTRRAPRAAAPGWRWPPAPPLSRRAISAPPRRPPRGTWPRSGRSRRGGRAPGGPTVPSPARSRLDPLAASRGRRAEARREERGPPALGDHRRAERIGEGRLGPCARGPPPPRGRRGSRWRR